MFHITWLEGVTEYGITRKKDQNQLFSLSDYQLHNPPSKMVIEKQTVALVTKFLRRNSRHSGVTVRKGDTTPSTSSISPGFPNSFHPNQVYFLEKTKMEVYNQMMAEHPGTRLSLDKFYKLCPKTFKMANKPTDMCQICEAGRNVEKEINQYFFCFDITIHLHNRQTQGSSELLSTIYPFQRSATAPLCWVGVANHHFVLCGGYGF